MTDGSETERVLFSIRDAIATVSLNRPDQLNALDTATLQLLRRSIMRASSDDSVRCLVLTGRGRAFCAGADVKEWAGGYSETNDDETSGDWTSLAHGIITTLYNFPKPVIAAVNGVAVGAGFDLCLAADFRIAAEAARFGSVYVRLGIPPDAGASFFLPRIVGLTKAKELIYTGRIFSSDEALKIGVVSEVVPSEDLMDATGRWATELADGPTVAIGLAKANLQDHQAMSLESALRSEQRAARIAMETADHKEGLEAVSSKRPPSFRGR